MNQPKSAKLAVSYFAWIVLFGICGIAAVGCTAPNKQSASTNAPYGRIHLNNDKGEEKCVLPLPDDYQLKTWNFAPSNAYCENDMVSTFWLENIPSATTIGFFENSSCSNNISKDNFYFVLKTVKQPTDWAPGGSVVQSIDGMRNSKKGELMPKRNVRFEEAFVGAEYNTKNLNERISCVSIQLSPPAN
jgi:hypothetical protein